MFVQAGKDLYEQLDVHAAADTDPVVRAALAALHPVLSTGVLAASARPPAPPAPAPRPGKAPVHRPAAQVGSYILCLQSFRSMCGERTFIEKLAILR